VSEGKRARKSRRKAMAAARWAAQARARSEKSCYCGPGDDFCSVCDLCGAPGHLRHFPGAAPVTGSWCDKHYRRLRVLHPNGTIGRWLHLVALAVVVATLLHLMR